MIAPNVIEGKFTLSFCTTKSMLSGSLNLLNFTTTSDVELETVV